MRSISLSITDTGVRLLAAKLNGMVCGILSKTIPPTTCEYGRFWYVIKSIDHENRLAVPDPRN